MTPPWLTRLDSCSRVGKFALLVGGYLAALGTAALAFWVCRRAPVGPEAEASSGMYAFRDAIIVLGVFSAGAVIPTALGIHFLRPRAAPWAVVALAVFLVPAVEIGLILLWFEAH